MAWRKSPPVLIDLFESVLPDDPRISRRKMFGYPSAFVNRNLFAGLHQDSFILRLSEADRDKARTEHNAVVFEPMPGRSMREYMVLPASVLSSREMLGDWIARSMRYAASLPPKTPRGRDFKPATSRRAKSGKWSTQARSNRRTGR